MWTGKASSPSESLDVTAPTRWQGQDLVKWSLDPHIAHFLVLLLDAPSAADLKRFVLGLPFADLFSGGKQL